METVLQRRHNSKAVSFKGRQDPIETRRASVLEMINRLTDEQYEIFYDDMLTACESRLAVFLRQKN